ncbi:hypothetical protein ACQXVK_14110 [Curtobacterium sp. AB451]|uniref:hypothetical protein n=1 Tax=Curtobacterium sp. AB451 TaxID=3422306 RepID=UPI003D335C3D
MNKRIVALIVATTTVVGSASVITATHAGVKVASAATGSIAVDPAVRGQEVFESLFFLQGGDRTRDLLRNADVSSLTNEEIDTVLAEVQSPESIAKVQKIEDELKASDDAYFARLGSTVIAGDPGQVQQYLTRAYEQMLQTPTMAEGVASLKANQTQVPGEIGTDCGVAVVVALGAVIAVTAIAAVNYALAANIALGYNVVAGATAVVKSAAVGGASERFSDGIVAAVIEQFGH